MKYGNKQGCDRSAGIPFQEYTDGIEAVAAGRRVLAIEDADRAKEGVKKNETKSGTTGKFSSQTKNCGSKKLVIKPRQKTVQSTASLPKIINEKRAQRLAGTQSIILSPEKTIGLFS